MAGKGFSKGHKKVGGRAKGTPNAINTDARRKIQEHAGEAVDALLKIIRDPDAKDAAIVAAANSILDRAWGKPYMSMQVTGNDAAPLIPVDPYQRRSILACYLYRLTGLAPRSV